jgi:hypothetical protein
VHDIELVLALLVAVVGVATISQRVNVPYPIVMVFGGILLAIVPGLRHV